LTGDVVISRSDIIYTPEAVKVLEFLPFSQQQRVFLSQAELGLLVTKHDRAFKAYRRVAWDEDGKVLGVGTANVSGPNFGMLAIYSAIYLAKTLGYFVGLAKISAEANQKIQNFYDTCYEIRRETMKFSEFVQVLIGYLFCKALLITVR
jgi:hypothetical protein